MKPFGSILAFTQQRNNELMKAYRHHIRKSAFVDMKRISREIVNSPASRFWVSPERATLVIAAMLAGKDLPENMRPTKAAMFSEIYKRVIKLKRQNPYEPLYKLVFDAVHSPAPQFYMLPRSAMDIIYKIKKKDYYELLKK